MKRHIIYSNSEYGINGCNDHYEFYGILGLANLDWRV